MPLAKHPRDTEPPWREWDRKAQKSGLRHNVYCVNGDHYTGEWQNNLKHGKGTYMCKSTNSIYEGDWKCGKRSGFGTSSVQDPITGEYVKLYSGCWKNNKQHGYGTFFYRDTEYYEGHWKAGQRSGWGRMHFANGEIYEGEWLEDKHSGQGMLLLANENRYEGSWKNGKKHGPGKFYYLDKGQMYEGTWVEDIPKCGTVVDFGRAEAPMPTKYPIPEVKVADPEGVLQMARSLFEKQE
ncbi:PREDICTED: MORN repeat-containing protein 3 [Nanorana parkeri]|uniref:MORN repeat-containing protein 3 n=1 Tax=Nanorana parkeri TaxID=125878 RepID=UPI00085456AD|nr:PREDICTED: MORN repeat-containing protein 3 [Nanorana parkeri]